MGRPVTCRDFCPVASSGVVVPVDIGQVAADGVALNSRVVAAGAAVDFAARLAEHVHTQLALAGEEALADGALQARAREMDAQVLPEVRAHLEAAAAFGARMGAEDVLRALCKVFWVKNKGELMKTLQIVFPHLLYIVQVMISK